MFQYMFILFALMAIVGASSLEMLTDAGFPLQYLLAFGIALMLKPWLKSQFD